MKRAMRLAWLAGCLLAVACGGGKRGGDAYAPTDPDYFTPENWQSVMRSEFGVEFAAPSGWQVERADAYMGKEVVTVVFKKGGGGAAPEKEVARAFFEATKKAASDGNFKLGAKMDDDMKLTTFRGEDYESFDDVYDREMAALLGEQFLNQSWCFRYKGGVKAASVESGDGELSVKLEHSDAKVR
ncbi:MAG: hypothetical protein LBT74_05840 [Acidobacteriota bacterium]|jgi:hypothetical protein|nr:hypothetical protein [Acidobacteriota bacterium]